MSGYCLCENGRRTAFSDCRHLPFTCQKRCASLPRLDCPRFDDSLRSNSAKGCAGIVTFQNRMKEAVQVMWVSDIGTETPLNEIHPMASYTVPFIGLLIPRSLGFAFPSAFACIAAASSFFSAPCSPRTRSCFRLWTAMVRAWLHGTIQRNRSR